MKNNVFPAKMNLRPNCEWGKLGGQSMEALSAAGLPRIDMVSVDCHFRLIQSSVVHRFPACERGLSEVSY